MDSSGRFSLCSAAALFLFVFRCFSTDPEVWYVNFIFNRLKRRQEEEVLT